MDGTEREPQIDTQVLPVDVDRIGTFIFQEPNRSFLGQWDIQLDKNSQDAANLREAVRHLQTSSLPIAFPTETVYGLGADATRADAVAGIYHAKRRPADNPLIVHVSSLTQIRKLLTPSSGLPSKSLGGVDKDLIPAVYHPLISRFWPGPLTILLPLPQPSPLASAVTGSLPTFGVRMPSSRLALAIIHLAGLPIAAPSANASTKPSPTTAAHVLHDLAGRISLIVDGGPCTVGVESTVVDGLVNTPVVLRPGGISIDMLRQCPGWENVAIGYRDGTETSTPRAPGMKYKHYSPKARVILVRGPLSLHLILQHIQSGKSVGLAKTKTWRDEHLTKSARPVLQPSSSQGNLRTFTIQRNQAISSYSEPDEDSQHDASAVSQPSVHNGIEEHPDMIQVTSLDLGVETASVAQNLFSALRELDLHGVDIILFETIDDTEGHEAAAIMNRLRKAAELQIQV